jgi:hypothetical protein
VRRIIIWYDGKVLFGVHLFDKDGKKVLETLGDITGKSSHEVIIEDNERIVGFRSKQGKGLAAAAHECF